MSRLFCCDDVNGEALDISHREMPSGITKKDYQRHLQSVPQSARQSERDQRSELERGSAASQIGKRQAREMSEYSRGLITQSGSKVTEKGPSPYHHGGVHMRSSARKAD